MCVGIGAGVHTVVIEALTGISVPLAPLAVVGRPYTFFSYKTQFLCLEKPRSQSAVHYLYQAIIHAGTFTFSHVSLRSKVTGV